MTMIHTVSGMPSVIGFALLMMIAGGAFVMAIRMRFGQTMLGKRPEIRWNEIPDRIKNVFIYVIAQKRLPRNGYLYSGILHMFIFGAFMVLSIDSIIPNDHAKATFQCVMNSDSAHYMSYSCVDEGDDVLFCTDVVCKRDE